MSENQKQDLWKVVSSQRLLNLQKMRDAKAVKAANKKNNVEPEPKVGAKVEPKPEQKIEEEVSSEDEVPVAIPTKRKKVTSPNQSLYGLQEEIQRIVQNSLPPDLRTESLKQKNGK